MSDTLKQFEAITEDKTKKKGVDSRSLSARQILDVTTKRLKQGRLSSVFSALDYDTLVNIKKEVETGIKANKLKAIEDKEQAINKLQKELEELKK